MYFIVAASSLLHAVNDVNLNFGDNQYHIEAVPGASFIHRNVEKRVEQILERVQFLDQDETPDNKRLQGRQIVLWHDVLNNSKSSPLRSASTTIE